MNENEGVFPRQIVRLLIQTRHIQATNPIQEEQIQPATLDLRIGSKAYRIQGLFTPQHQERVKDLLQKYSLYEINLDDEEAILEKNAAYLFEMQENLELDFNTRAIASNKTSTARVGLLTRLVTDFNPHFNHVKDGYSGKLYLQVLNKSFLIGVKKGQSLNQIRFYNGAAVLNDLQLSLAVEKHHFLYKNDKPLTWRDIRIHEGILLTLDLRREICGWVNKTTNDVLHLDRYNHYPVTQFWEPLSPSGENHVVLCNNNIYLFSTREKIRVPPGFGAGLIGFNNESGEFRSHETGYFQPGIGHGWNGEFCGTTAVLPIRPLNTNIILRHGQPICRLAWEKLIEPAELRRADLPYEHLIMQGPSLSKHFKAPMKAVVSL